jgi:hypothetical protein
LYVSGRVTRLLEHPDTMTQCLDSLLVTNIKFFRHNTHRLHQNTSHTRGSRRTNHQCQRLLSLFTLAIFVCDLDVIERVLQVFHLMITHSTSRELSGHDPNYCTNAAGYVPSTWYDTTRYRRSSHRCKHTT